MQRHSQLNNCLVVLRTIVLTKTGGISNGNSSAALSVPGGAAITRTMDLFFTADRVIWRFMCKDLLRSKRRAENQD